MKGFLCILISIGVAELMSSSPLVAIAKKSKKFITENGGDFEFIDEVSFIDLFIFKFKTN